MPSQVKGEGLKILSRRRSSSAGRKPPTKRFESLPPHLVLLCESSFLPLRDALTEVGRLYEEAKYYLSDLILAAGMCEDVLKRTAPRTQPKAKGKVVLGTVQGSVHGMGKNIVADLLRAEGYVVYDLGVDVPAERFVEKIRVTGAQVLGLSVGLIQALPSIGEVVEALKRAGLRDSVKIIVGGNAATLERVLELGCDAYAQSAVAGLKVIDKWMGNKVKTEQS